MYGTLFALIFAGFIFFQPVELEKFGFFNILIPFFITISLILIFIENVAFAFAWTPLQKASKSITPHLLNNFKKDRVFKLVNIWLFVFVLITLFIAMEINSNIYYQNSLIAIWIVLFGFSYDSLQYSLKHVLSYLNPFAVLDLFEKEGIKNIQDQQEIDLCDKIDAISETAIKGIDNKTPLLANYALNVIQNIDNVFLESSKSMSNKATDSQTENLGIHDKITYTLSYIYQRTELIFLQALDAKLETVLNASITRMGKMAISASKCDISLALHPLIFLGKFAGKAVENKFHNVGILAICTLLEVAKEIVSSQDLTYLEIQEAFLCLIGQLENISKELFRQDKQIKIMILMEPFLELKQLFSAEKMVNHQDTPIIMKDLDRVIAELQILENVMRTMPPIMPFSDEKKRV